MSDVANVNDETRQDGLRVSVIALASTNFSLLKEKEPLMGSSIIFLQRVLVPAPVELTRF